MVVLGTYISSQVDIWWDTLILRGISTSLLLSGGLFSLLVLGTRMVEVEFCHILIVLCVKPFFYLGLILFREFED